MRQKRVPLGRKSASKRQKRVKSQTVSRFLLKNELLARLFDVWETEKLNEEQIFDEKRAPRSSFAPLGTSKVEREADF